MIELTGIEKEKYLKKYYHDNARYLHYVVDNMIKKFGGIYEKDIDDFYSLANEVFTIALIDFNGTGSFDGFFRFRLLNKIKSMITKRNRQKRSDITSSVNKDGEIEITYHPVKSLDEMVVGKDGNESPLGELIADKNIEDMLSDDIGFLFSDKVNAYLNNLPITTKKVAMLIGDGYSDSDIKEKLKMSNQEYSKHMNTLSSYEYIKILL